MDGEHDRPVGSKVCQSCEAGRHVVRVRVVVVVVVVV
jgi:hypothetical protein